MTIKEVENQPVFKLDSVSFLYGIVKNIVILLAADTIVLIGMLFVGLVKMDLRAKE